MNEAELKKQKAKFQMALQSHKSIKYIQTEVCPVCGGTMKYAYGETFECLTCGKKTLSEFGKVRQYLDDHGPQNAYTISEATGVSVIRINEFLREGRVEIPDGSGIYIRCQCCGTDIRYGRYCPDCMLKLTNGLSKAVWMPEVGEKPTVNAVSGKMHINQGNDERVSRRKSAFGEAKKEHWDGKIQNRSAKN